AAPYGSAGGTELPKARRAACDNDLATKTSRPTADQSLPDELSRRLACREYPRQAPQHARSPASVARGATRGGTASRTTHLRQSSEELLAASAQAPRSHADAERRGPSVRRRP